MSIHTHNVKDSDIGDTVGEDHLFKDSTASHRNIKSDFGNY